MKYMLIIPFFFLLFGITLTDAARVLSKGHHVLHNVELCVRRPASKDQYRLLLRGINPDTSTEMIELYVENLMGLNMPDYTLYPSPGRDFILISLSQPLSKGGLITHVSLFFNFLKNHSVFCTASKYFYHGICRFPKPSR